MVKQVSISYCWQCPHQQKRYLIGDDGLQVVDGAICSLTSEELEYIHYAGFKVDASCAFPETCPLGGGV